MGNEDPRCSHFRSCWRNPRLRWRHFWLVFFCAHSGVWQHRQGLADGFTARHGVKRLVWYEQHETMPAAIAREKALKHWRREWKIRLIEEGNPGWRDLWGEIAGG